MQYACIPLIEYERRLQWCSTDGHVRYLGRWMKMGMERFVDSLIVYVRAHTRTLSSPHTICNICTPAESQPEHSAFCLLFIVWAHCGWRSWLSNFLPSIEWFRLFYLPLKPLFLFISLFTKHTIRSIQIKITEEEFSEHTLFMWNTSAHSKMFIKNITKNRNRPNFSACNRNGSSQSEIYIYIVNTSMLTWPRPWVYSIQKSLPINHSNIQIINSYGKTGTVCQPCIKNDYLLLTFSDGN